MEELHITKISPEELLALIEKGVALGVQQAIKELAEAKARSPSEEEDKFLSIKEVARMLGRSRQTCYNLIERKILIPHRQSGIRGMVFKLSQAQKITKQITFKYLKKHE